MVDFLNEWAQKIIVVVIICTIIEMILPDGKNKKYIKTVAGIYVVFTIIGPIISKIDIKQELNLQKYFNFSGQNIVETSVTLDNNKYIEEVYKEKINSDIRAKIKALGYEVEKLNLEIETEKEEYGAIISLDLKVIKKEQEQENSIKIEPITIGNKELKEETKISTEEAEKIKDYLAEIYYLDKKKIKIE